MKNAGKLGIMALSIAIAGFAITGCQKNNVDRAQLTVKMTDAPAVYDEVNVDVRQVQVHYEEDSSSSGGWVTINTKAGIYDLLTLQNNVIAVIAADSLLLPGKINQWRMVLGDSNYVVIDSVAYDLKVPSGSQSGLKLNVNQTIKAGSKYEMLVDFDAARSIVETGKGEYLLKPVLVLKELKEL